MDDLDCFPRRTSIRQTIRYYKPLYLTIDKQNTIYVSFYNDYNTIVEKYDSQFNFIEIFKTFRSNRFIKNIINIDSFLFLSSDGNVKKMKEDDRNKKCLVICKNINYDQVEIDYKGKISKGYQGLQIGNEYYIQSDGNLDINITPYYYGFAISHDQLII